jgi:hypothetical protein
MTRDEATKFIDQTLWDGHGSLNAERWVLIFEKLGMLKLDEPKRLPQKLRDFIRDARLVQGGEMERLENLQAVLADAGLRIIEK